LRLKSLGLWYIYMSIWLCNIIYRLSMISFCHVHF
jgi:hypothetical protein